MNLATAAYAFFGTLAGFLWVFGWTASAISLAQGAHWKSAAFLAFGLVMAAATYASMVALS